MACLLASLLADGGAAVSGFLGGSNPFRRRTTPRFRHPKPGQKVYKWRSFHARYDDRIKAQALGLLLQRQAKLALALGQYPLITLAEALIKRDSVKKLLAEGHKSVRRPPEERPNARMAGPTLSKPLPNNS